jgi:hypothetical protein
MSISQQQEAAVEVVFNIRFEFFFTALFRCRGLFMPREQGIWEIFSL